MKKEDVLCGQLSKIGIALDLNYHLIYSLPS